MLSNLGARLIEAAFCQFCLSLVVKVLSGHFLDRLPRSLCGCGRWKALRMAWEGIFTLPFPSTAILNGPLSTAPDAVTGAVHEVAASAFMAVGRETC